MLRFSEDQVDVFRSATLANFEVMMMDRCSVIAPRRSAALGKAGLHAAVRAAVRRAAGRGFTFRGPVRLFVELSLMLGSEFDRDVQYAFAAKILAEDGAQQGRSDELHAHASAAVLAIGGPGGRHDHDAWLRLRGLVATGPAWPGPDLAGSLLTAMAAVHPEKFACVGEPALRSLVVHAEAEANRHDMHAPEDVALVAGLMFALGQGCLADPFHPWIAASVDRERHPDRSSVGALLRAEVLTRIGVA